MKVNRILFLLHLPPPVHGSSMVGKSISDSFIINTSFSCNFLNLLASNRVKESGRVSFIKLVGFLKSLFTLIKSLLFNKFDLVYYALTTTGLAFYRDVIFVAIIKLFRVKIIYHIHNKGVRAKQKVYINRVFYKYVFNDSSVILLSERLFVDIESFVEAKSVYYCPNGLKEIDEPIDSPETSSSPIRILFLSNLIEAKGIGVLLNACALLKASNIDFQCDFVGGEGDVSSIDFKQRVETLKLCDKVNYLGIKYGKEKNLTLAAADIFVLPTYYTNECFPLVLLEAMQFQLPIISCPEGGIEDIVEDGINGFLVSQQDVQELADRLALLINDKELRKRLGKEGRYRYEQEFTIDKFENRLLEILLMELHR